jgi:hypothetical protein
MHSSVVVVHLNRTGHRVAIAIGVHLADVIQRHVGLVAIAWAQVEKQGLDLVNCKGVHPCACSTIAGRLKLNGTILKGMVENIGLNLLRGQRTEVSGAKKYS